MIVLFDGKCNFCNASVNFIIDRDCQGIFKFAALQSDIGKDILKRNQLQSTDLDSIILVDAEKIYNKSDAALEISRHLDGFWKVFYIFKIVPKFIRDTIYDFVARNRYQFFGENTSCRIPSPAVKARFL